MRFLQAGRRSPSRTTAEIESGRRRTSIETPTCHNPIDHRLVPTNAESAAMGRQRGHYGATATARSVILIAGLGFLLTPCAAGILDAGKLGHLAAQPLRPRDPREHVILADCETSGTVSSQIAYYEDDIDSTPRDVAIVNTPDNTTQRWENGTSSAFFVGPPTLRSSSPSPSYSRSRRPAAQLRSRPS